jgi:uncharacterized protein (TIGR02453 family)
MAPPPGFAFPAATLAFLADLSCHNDKAWFDANRTRYQAAYIEPAKAFVEAVAPALDTIVPGIHAEPKVLGSIFRINRDTRFSADKRPYKDHLDFWFWEGDRRAAVSGLFLRVAPAGVVVGAGAHGFDKHQLARYRAAVTDAAARADLTEVVAALERGRHTVEGESYTRTPPGYNADGAAVRLLRQQGTLTAEGRSRAGHVRVQRVKGEPAGTRPLRRAAVCAAPMTAGP